MNSRMENNFSGAHCNTIPCFCHRAVSYGRAIWQSRMAKPYGTAIWQSHMAKTYGRAIWQCHMAAVAAAAAAAAALRYNGRPDFFFRNFTLEKRTLKNINHAKKNRLKILYRTPYLKIRDLFSRANFDYFLFSTNSLNIAKCGRTKFTFLRKPYHIITVSTPSLPPCYEPYHIFLFLRVLLS